MKRRKRSQHDVSPLIRLVGLEAAVAVAGLAGSPGATAAPGDLDPSFGDVGRQAAIHDSYLFDQWSVAVQDDDSVLVGGGGESCPFGCYDDYFIGRLLPDGTSDATFSAVKLDSTIVRDTVLQADGKLVGVGMDGSTLLIFRLQPNGALDPTFGAGGKVRISDAGAGASDGHSVTIDPDGRIVVAGSRGNALLVARLQPNGALDDSFGMGGTFVMPAPGDYGSYPALIARAPGGGYRVAAHRPQQLASGDTTSTCSVVGLTGSGTLDAAFGTAGITQAPVADNELVRCSSVAVLGDGRILLGGTGLANERGYVRRLLADGTLDGGFHAEPVADQLSSVSALGVGAAGAIFAAGRDRAGSSGALVMRLLADGTPDTLFGRAGTARVDLRTRRVDFAAISDLQVAAKDALVVAGTSRRTGGVFVARLLGNAAGGSPGVLSMTQDRSVATEQGGRAVLTVRRTGGSEGAIAVSYSTRDFPDPTASGSSDAPGARATSGADYTSTTGRLTWAAGDVSERQVEIPIAPDTNAEPPEFFEVVLDSPEGGAGLGAYGADVEIVGASYPAGEFSIQAAAPSAAEGMSASFYVSRDFYSQGAASVTVRVVPGGSATPGQDFRSAGRNDWQDVVLTWGDGEAGTKVVAVPIARDGSAEPTESFTLELAAPTGGASLGATMQASVTLIDTTASRGSSGGGGGCGGFGALLLGLLGAWRRR